MQINKIPEWCLGTNYSIYRDNFVFIEVVRLFCIDKIESINTHIKSIVKIILQTGNSLKQNHLNQISHIISVRNN